MDRRGLYDDRAYWKQAMSLKNQGYDVSYLVISYFENSDKGTTIEGVNYQVIKSKSYFRNTLLNYIFKKLFPVSNEFDEMFALVEKLQPDLIQFVDLRPLRLLKKIKNLASKPKILYDIREPRDNNLLDIRMKNWRIPFFLKKLYANHVQHWEYKKTAQCDYVIGVDNGIEKRITKNLPEKLYQTIYNYTNLDEFRENIPLKNRKYDAAYVGGLSEIRGVKTIAKAVKILKHHVPNVKVLLLGNAHVEELQIWLKKYINENQLNENIIWIPSVPYQEVPTFYNDVKIGLNPLHYAKAHEEIIQIKLFEYMNYGLPIITGNFGEMQKYITKNQVGICIEPDNPKLLADTIFDLLTNPDKMKFFSNNGVKAVDEKFNWRVMENKYLAIVKQLLNA